MLTFFTDVCIVTPPAQEVLSGRAPPVTLLPASQLPDHQHDRTLRKGVVLCMEYADGGCLADAIYQGAFRERSRGELLWLLTLQK